MSARSGAALLAALGATLGLCACAGSLETLGAAWHYQHAALPDDRIRLDLPYRDDPEADPHKHRLDLFLPSEARAGWPTLVFVHGGGWTAGDRAVGALGIEPIRNLGRYWAARGYGVVVPSYRLQPDVHWPDQIDDVARAVAWVRREIAGYGGSPEAIFLGGHSAGAWLAAWVGLDDGALAAQGFDRSALCALLLVSGAAYDLEDEQTWTLGASRRYFEDLFGRTRSDWARAASILHHRADAVPPVLVMSGGGEPAKFQRQGDLLYESVALAAPGSRRVVVPAQDHQRILVSLSRAGDPAARAAGDFLAAQRCPR